MFSRIMANEDVFYRSEQRDTPDLTVQQKRDILKELYQKNPILFISRYYKYLITDDFHCFDMDNYEISMYMNIIKDRLNTNKNIMVRNRRYAELIRLKKETDYFSNSKMREREPILFDKMIGKFLPEEEQSHLRPTVHDEKFSSILLRLSEKDCNNSETSDRFISKSKDICDDEEFGSLAKHAKSRLDNYDKNSQSHNSSMEFDSGDDIKQYWDDDDDDDKAELEKEFIDYMEQRFLTGKDGLFVNYDLIDGQQLNKEFEKLRERDLEDAYFSED
ncbi:unnamed protein product [Dracunculus medinensis]|uniref:DUF2052 domain-containing protein n=1 Tax=Dracunculus medinensis TaxID=318479 RepID=A0A0N4U5Q6_DRAME|nr:unnamed protein product [Dracunculus medinensis]